MALYSVAEFGAGDSLAVLYGWDIHRGSNDGSAPCK